MIPGSANPLLLAAEAEAGAYEIERSLRFNSSDSGYLGATFGTPTDQDVFTLSMWVKRSALGSTQRLFGVSTNHSFGFTSGDALNLTFGGSSALTTTALFRDPSAFYHILWVQNGTAHTLYVNDASVGTATATSNTFNTAVAHQIGAGNTANFFNGYLADVIFVDGQALTPSSFTEVSATTGQLIPKAYTGSYGTNGFHLPFSDNSTAAALGTDTSGNSNTWTVNNISVSAGAGNDSLVDTPTSYGTDTGAGGEVRGNYCTWNPLCKGSTTTLSNGNLDMTSGNYWKSVVATIGATSGKWYWEQSMTTNQYSYTGICNQDFLGSVESSWPSKTVNSWGYLTSNGLTRNDAGGGSEVSVTLTAMASGGGVIGFALDLDNQKLWFALDGVWMGSGSPDPATGTSPAFTNLVSGDTYFPCADVYAASASFNFGQRPFAYTAPSGYKALCTTNLPAPVVAQPSTVMDVKLYTGNGSTQTISGLGFSPDFVWIKERNAAADHALYDIVRGTQARLESNTTDAEATSDSGLTAFNSDGFALSTLAQVNTNNDTYVAWTWDAGSSTVTNTDGSITSQVRANASAGFSIVTYTGTGANATVGHGLGVAPGLVIVKCRSAANDWGVYHSANTSDPKTDYLLLNSTAATADDNTPWNDTAPTSTVFSIGTNADVNTNTATYVAYCWAPQVGYSSFGSYTGNGNADGPFVYLGFRPAVVIVKMSSSTSNWTILDDKREGYNVDNDPLYPNVLNAEGTTDLIDITSNGFKVRTTDASFNTNAGTYVYAAWASSPFAYARAR